MKVNYQNQTAGHSGDVFDISIAFTANVNLYHVTKFSIYLSFTVYSYSKIGKFTPILSIRIVLKAVFICAFLILKLSQLESHVCRLP